MEFVAQDHPAPAKMAEKIIALVEQLSEYPSSGRPDRVPGTRELVVPDTPCILPYRVRNDVVEILRVFHAARRRPGSL